ncbi:hypothetical protein PP639_gp095 [Arthrobacter phage Seahorse]|uniref:Uncharacterized protein n=1 Tax=Arthrobacter phage Seahorse TaxID=2419611 RepID=A0A3G3M581_9CAUD|nr:hypothetical protein PP639_gp095 [Arthrobacter phage Seahorse]AYR01595.1 hypothetical protein PBI_SEAHORSE_95 [Arthrobacter phage Seahorse]
MSGKRKPSGHPAKQDPDVAKLFRAMRSTVELVRDLEGKLAPDVHLNLRASALGMMHAYAAITGLPAPNELLKGTP